MKQVLKIILTKSFSGYGKFIFAIKFLLIIISFLIVTCNGKVPIDKLKNIANKQFGKPVSQESINPDKINIVVDISESMKGFANTGSFQELFRKSITALGLESVSYYKLDTTIKQINDYEQFFNANLFKGSAANFQRAFSYKELDTNRISIIITDFQFNNNTQYMGLIRIFQTEMKKGRYIKIFSAKLDFNGDIFPQFNNKKKYNYPGPRPLYAIAIGEHRHAEFIEKVLKKVMPGENSITISSEIPIEWKIFYSHAKIIGKSFNYLEMSSTDSLLIKLKVISPGILEWGEWSKDEVVSNSYSYKDTVFVPIDGALTIRNIQTRNDTCTLTFFAKEISPTPVKLWRIYFRPNEVPDWIIDQSCEPSGNQAIMTVYLKEFIQDIIRQVTNPFTVATLNIFLNKN